MDLKFYLNKFLKVDNIEYYTLDTLKKLRSVYDKYVENSEGIDPDFPNMVIGDHSKGEKIKGVNYYSIFGGEENIPKGDKGLLNNKIKLK